MCTQAQNGLKPKLKKKYAPLRGIALLTAVPLKLEQKGESEMRSIKENFIKYILPSMFFFLILSLLFLQDVFNAIDLIHLPKKIQVEQYKNNIKNTERTDLIYNYEVWVKKSYTLNKEKDEYVLNKDLSSEQTRVLGERMILFLHPKLRTQVLNIFIYLQIFSILIAFGISANKGIINFYNLYLMMLFFIALALLKVGSMLINVDWP